MRYCHRKINKENCHYLIIATFTLLQLLVLALFGYTPYPDSNGYIGLAADCVSLGDLYPAVSRLNDDLAFIWNVGSIDAVILSLKLFNSVMPLLILYSVAKGATAWLLHAITAKVFNKNIALIALILYVAYPANYGEGTSVQSETPFIFLTLLGLYAAICHDRPFIAAAIIAVANWFRPMGLVFLMALLIYRRKGVLRTITGYLAVVLIIGSLSFFRTGHFIYQAKTGWMALLQYSVDNTKDDNDNSLTFTGKVNAVEKDRIWQKRFMEWLRQHPKEYVMQMPKKLVSTYVSDNVNLCVFIPDKQHKRYMYEEIDMRHIVKDFPHYSTVQAAVAANLVYYYALMLMFVAGVVLMLKRKEYNNAALPLSVVVTGTAVLLLFGHGEARFHIPFMPFVIMSAAYFLCFKRK